MLGLIARRFLTDSYGLLDRILEFGVFLLIAYEVFARVHEDHKLRRRKAEVFGYWSKGQTLQATAPTRYGPEHTLSWLSAVNNWHQETQEFLEKYSVEAVASFLHATWEKTLPQTFYNLADQAREPYKLLLTRLDNLKGIMENSDVYF